MTLEYYTAAGKRQYARAGQVIPAGSMILRGKTWVTFTEPATVRIGLEEGNPYDQCSRDKQYLFAQTATEAAKQRAEIEAHNAALAERQEKRITETPVPDSRKAVSVVNCYPDAGEEGNEDAAWGSSYGSGWRVD